MQQNHPVKKIIRSKPSMHFLSFVLLPFKVLYYSHIYYLLYVVASAYLLHYCTQFAIEAFHEWLSTLMKEYPLSFKFWAIASSTGTAMVYVFALPVVMAIVAAPVRHVHLYNRIRPGLLANEMPVAIKNTLQCLFVMSSRIIKALVPVLVLGCGYYFWAADAANRSIPQVYMLVATIVSSGIIVHHLPVFFSPLVSAVAGFHAFQAVNITPQVLEKSRFKLGLLLALGLGLSIVSTQYLQSFLGSSYAAPFVLAINTFWIWYFLNHILFLLLVKVLEFQHGQPVEGSRLQQLPEDIITVENIEIN